MDVTPKNLGRNLAEKMIIMQPTSYLRLKRVFDVVPWMARRATPLANALENPHIAMR